MGKASISIAISGSYNGAAVAKAEKSLDRLAVRTAAAEGSMSKSWVEAGSKAAEAGGRIYSVGQRVAEAGDAMTAGVTVPLVAMGTASAKTAIDFESSMSRVSGALNDPSANMGELRQLALDMGADTVFSASEAGAAMEELAKGGLSAADIKGGALKTTMDLAAAGSLNLADAANATVQVMGAFELSADQTGEAANALAGAAAASSADVSDLTQGLSQVSAQAHSAGWSIQDTTAVLGAFADAGIQGSDAGTSLKTMLQRLAAPTDDAAATMESLGINVRDSNGNMVDAASVAGILQSKLGGLDSATRDAALQTIFGADASRAAIVMMNQGTEGIQRYTAATNDQAAAQRLADSQMGETQSSIEQMNGAIETASIQVGSALAPAVTDVANAVGGAAQSFSEMDDGTQQAVVGFGLVAAAAGPVLSVSGRIVKGAGSMVTAYGKAKQQVATYADALTTTNAASLKAYQGNEKLAKALEKNPAAKAAGGVNEYVSAVQKANADTSKYESAVRNLSNEQKKGSKANQELVANLQAEVSEKKQAMETSTGLVQGYQQEATAAATSTAAAKAHAVGLATLSAAANVAKVALATIAPMAIVAGITFLVGKFQEAKEHADNLSAATEGLTSAANGATNEVAKESSALDLLTGNASAAKADVDGMLESQAQLASTMRQTNTDAAAQRAQLQQAYSIIQQYANQTDLSTEAQGRLRTAVETVNGMCGTQIQVTDSANGVLSDENGAIQDVTGSLGDYVSKKLEQIRVDAQQENLTALYKQQADDIETLTQAQKAYNDKLSDHDRYVNEYIATCGPYLSNAEEMAEAAWQNSLAQSDEAKAVDEAKSALDAVNTSIDNVSSSLGASVEASSGATAGITTLAQASPTVTTAMNAINGDLNDFSQDLADAGVSVAQFNQLNDEQLVQLVSSWDGTSQSIVSSLDGMSAGMADKGTSAVNALSSALSSGRVPVESATEALKDASTGDWSGVLSIMQQNGISIPQSVADGITANGYQPSSATSAMISAVALQLTGGDVTAAAELLGHDIDAGLAQAISDNDTEVLTNTYNLTQDTIDKAREGFQTHSPSVVFQQIGADVDSGLANGIDGNTSGPLSSIGNLVQQVIGATDNLPGDMQNRGGESSQGLSSGLLGGLGSVIGSATSLFTGAKSGVSGTPSALAGTGRSAGSGFASGIGSGRGSASSNASSLANAAQGGVNGAPGALSGIGRSASSQFASGIGSGRGSVSSNASGLANAAKAAKNYGNSYSWGSDLGSNFAAGIRAARGWVSSAANAIANAAKSVLHFSAPEEGPWSGAEKGGVRSGQHLAQNFAHGMRLGSADVQDAARRLAQDAAISSPSPASHRIGPDPSQKTVANTYYSMGDVTIDASSIQEFMTMEEFFRFMRRAKAGR